MTGAKKLCIHGRTSSTITYLAAEIWFRIKQKLQQPLRKQQKEHVLLNPRFLCLNKDNVTRYVG